MKLCGYRWRSVTSELLKGGTLRLRIKTLTETKRTAMFSARPEIQP